jgi:hypothetical protein
MLRAPLSNGAARAAALVCGLAVLGGCARAQTPGWPTAPGSSPAVNGGRVGYVRMEQLLKVHPLYAQLAHLDEDVEALQLKSVGPGVARTGGDIAQQELELQRELDAAAERTKKALAGKQQDYAKREQAAINAALGAAAGVNGPGGATIASGVAQEARAQAQSASQAAEHNFEAYRGQLIEQNRVAIGTLQRTLAARADRQYRGRADALQRKESDYALQLASDDAADRLSLRTKLSNLALDDASRADVKAQLDVLARKEADGVGAMRNRDEATLAAYSQTLRAQVRGELTRQVADLQKRTVAKIGARATQTRAQLASSLGSLPGGGPGGPARVDPQMRQKLLSLHARFQGNFNKDAAETIAAFQKTRVDLTRRFRELAGVDSQAQMGADRQIGALQKQRGDLYGEMIAQIDREVKSIATKRGIDVVVSDVVAPAGGIDLTDDAEKDIESLHE